MKRVVIVYTVGIACLAAVLFGASIAWADTLKSSHYSFTESTIGSGGLVLSTSPSYKVGSILGDTAIGNASSNNFQFNAGSKTTNDPALSLAVNSASTNFGTFSATSPSVATETFAVLDYTSYGYIVQIIGNPPSNGSHTIAAMAATGSSVSGTEQFGINLVANTSPVTFGANPNHGQFGFGSATSNYGSANAFRYVSGETIASAPKSSGLTTYTISYLVNVGDITPGGQYTSSQVVICTATY